MNPIERMRELVSEFRHWQAEHGRTQVDSRSRRREGGRLKEIEEHFQALLERWIDDSDERKAWLAHLYDGGPAPSTSLATPPLFKGQSESGSDVVVVPRGDGSAGIIVDGKPMDRLPADVELGSTFRWRDLHFEETFDGRKDAIEALIAYIDDPSLEFSWEHARELFKEGLIDQNFGLTARGQRLIRRRRAA